MFDFAWSELLLVAVLAIVFIGPKDLPKLMRTFGEYAGKMRAMAREFQNAFEDIARESELDELRKQVAELRETTMKPLTDAEQAIRQAQITNIEVKPAEPEAVPASVPAPASDEVAKP
ncbi:MAG: Sec-independent protein translocase protein TatB [Parvibaculaceae bacterium]